MLVTSKIKVISCFSVSRTGSNYLSNVLRQLNGIDVYSEIFHPDEAFSIPEHIVEHMCERYSINTHLPLDSKNPQFITFVRENPIKLVAYLRELAEQKGKKAIYFKVFNEHIVNQPDIVRLVDYFDSYPWILQRYNIDSFISFRKAMKHGVWASKDTSNFKVELSLKSYLRWSAPRRYWYQFLESNLPHRNIRHIKYESDIDIDSAQCLERFRSYIYEILGETLPNTQTKKNLLQKQDISDRESKVSNWNDFKVSLEDCGLYDEAVGYFLSEREFR